MNNDPKSASSVGDHHTGGYQPLIGLQSLLPNLKPWPAAISALELCSNPPETPAVLIEGMLYRGGTMIVSGPSKARKTYTLLDAGLSIAAGRPWLDLVTSKTNVLYLNMELQEFAVAKRVARIAEAKEMTVPSNLYFLNLRDRVTGVSDIERELPEKLNILDVGLVIVDPLYKVAAYSGAEENSNDQQAAFLGRLQEVCGDAKAAIMFAHHFAKGSAANKNQIDRASGGGVFARWPDVIMTLTEHKQPEAMTMEFTLRNFAPIDSFVARWEYPMWRIDRELNPANLKRAGASTIFTAEVALKVLSIEGMTYSEWFIATGWKESTFRRRRDELVNDLKTVVRRGDKYYPAKPVGDVPCAKFSFKRPEGWGSQDSQNSQIEPVAVLVAKAEPTIQPPPCFNGGGGRHSDPAEEPGPKAPRELRPAADGDAALDNSRN